MSGLDETMKGASEKLPHLRSGEATGAASHPRRRSMSASQKAALDDALVQRLRLYPRGYAASKSGPFHSRQAVLSLVRAGLLHVSSTMLFASVTERGRETARTPR